MALLTHEKMAIRSLETAKLLPRTLLTPAACGKHRAIAFCRFTACSKAFALFSLTEMLHMSQPVILCLSRIRIKLSPAETHFAIDIRLGIGSLTSSRKT
jgi:hypothetical protein